MKRSVKSMVTALLATATLPLVLASCGDKDDDEKKVAVETGSHVDDDKTTTTPTGTTHTHPSPSPQPSPAQDDEPGKGDAIAADPLVGMFEQVDNRQAKIQITDLLLVNTNLVIPSPTGDGTRLSPKFPHALVYDAAKGVYKTIGFYNDATSVFKNVELRLRLYSSDQLLDVTLAIPPGDGTGPTPGPSPNPSPNPGPCCDPCCCDPCCDPCCYDPCCCPPSPPCCQPPCPNPGGGGGGGGGDQQLLYQYRYERVTTDGSGSSL